MKAHLSSLMRMAHGLPDAAPATAAVGPDAEALARDLSAAFIDKLRQFRRARDGDLNLLEIEELKNGGLSQAVRNKSPDKVSFLDLEGLSRSMPEEALQLWEEVKAAARNDLANGWHAARAVRGDAWGRACFLAIRDQLRQLWPPRNGLEAMLLDEMAQYELLRRHLIDRMWGGSWACDNERGRQYPATAEMGRTIERLQRLFQQALRALVAVRGANATPAVQRIEPTKVAADRTRNPGAAGLSTAPELVVESAAGPAEPEA
jgi:hypothetical protein